MSTVRELHPADASELAALYEHYEWWADRTPATVERALRNTEVALGVEDDAGNLVAAARILTDYTYYANVFDVIVAADRRDEGYGEELMQAVVDHPDLPEPLPGLSLLCREGLVPFYESVGFDLFEREMQIPEGGMEELVRMTYQHGTGEGT